MKTPGLSLISLALLVLVSIHAGQGQGRTCYYLYGVYYCYNNVVQRVVQTCSYNQATYYYWNRSYNDCCATGTSVTSGKCCQHTWYGYYQCMCSYGTVCYKGSTATKPVTAKPTTAKTAAATTPVVTTAKATTQKVTTIAAPTTIAATTTPATTTAAPTTVAATTTPATTTAAATTTPGTTTTAAPKVCPTYRLLNSEAAKECDYPGITSIERKDGAGGTISSCNAVLVPATVKGVTKPAFFTSKFCKNILQNLAINGKTEFNFKIGNKSFPVDVGSMFDIVDDPKTGSSFFVVKDRFASLLNFAGSCQNPACSMTTAMAGKLDYSNCDVVSYGAMDTGLATAGLRKVKVGVTVNSLCVNQTEVLGEVNTMCFRAKSGKNLLCSNDMGAAVFCPTTDSKEKVLVGVASFSGKCDTSPSFRLIPYPLTGATTG